MEKIRKKLSTWRDRMLFFVRRICLIKFVIFVLSLYCLSSIWTEITKIQMNFLWGGVQRIENLL